MGSRPRVGNAVAVRIGGRHRDILRESGGVAIRDIRGGGADGLPSRNSHEQLRVEAGRAATIRGYAGFSDKKLAFTETARVGRGVRKKLEPKSGARHAGQSAGHRGGAVQRRIVNSENSSPENWCRLQIVRR